ncbi:MAG: methyltransferase, TIGR04325 family [Rubrivivax sp.]|nr:MAG: methyltransferase, TIGR04325 family [Rubrivivax sp.]
MLMTPRQLVTRTVGHVKKLPGIEALRRRRHLAHFFSSRGYGAHYGVFSSFEQARDWLPKTGEFDRPEFSEEYLGVRTQRVFAYDYPVMFWLKMAFAQGATSVFDIGGSVGVHYYAYSKFLDYPEQLHWTVCELSHAVRLGRELAVKEDARQLHFTESMAPAEIAADVLIMAGTLEFIEDWRFGDFLRRCQRRPNHILLNKLPLHNGDDFVSTQHICAGAFAPHHVFNRAKFIESVEREGYRLVDAWDVPDRSFFMPGHPDKSFDTYSGLHFQAI